MVDQIATVGLVDAAKIRMTLLNRWLPSRHARQQQESTDVTMTGDEAFSAANSDMEVMDTATIDEEEIDLLRAVYILERCADAPLYLIRFILEGAEDVRTTPMCQVRGLRCLLALVDIVEVERLSERRGWHSRLASMLYDGELRRLRILSTSQSVDGVDKSALARAVCRSRDQSAARVGACLAIDFGLDDEPLWVGIVRRLSANDVRVLLRSLPWCGQHISSAIVSLVSSALAVESLDKSLAADVFSLIQRIPSPVDGDTLVTWADRFLVHGMPACAVACRMLQSSVQHNDQLRALLGSESGNIVAEIDSFERKGRVFMMSNRIRDMIKTNRASSNSDRVESVDGNKSVVFDDEEYRVTYMAATGSCASGE